MFPKDYLRVIAKIRKKSENGPVGCIKFSTSCHNADNLYYTFLSMAMRHESSYVIFGPWQDLWLWIGRRGIVGGHLLPTRI